jgi:hypothetical protein
VVFWPVADSILANGSLAFRLSPAEVARLGELGRLGSLESPDDLLSWMIDRVDTRHPSEDEHRAEKDPE